jgi:hypothetical protein
VSALAPKEGPPDMYQCTYRMQAVILEYLL